MNLAQLKARLAEISKEINEILAKDKLTPEDQAKLKALTFEVDGGKDAEGKDVEGLDSQIKTLEAAQRASAAAARPAGETAGNEERNLDPTTGKEKKPAEVEKKEVKAEEQMTFTAAAAFKAKHSNKSIVKVLSEEGYGQLADHLMREYQKRQIDTTSIAASIPAFASSRVIDLLRAQTTFFQGGPKRATFTNGKFQALRVTSSVQAEYVGEGERKPVTDAGFDTIQMTPKKLAGIVLITKEAKDWSIVDIEAWIKEDLRRSMSLRIDREAYFGTGTGQTPTGIFNLSGVPQFNALGGAAPTIPQIDSTLSRMTLSLTQANIGTSPKWAWLMSYRTLEYLKNVRIGDDNNGYYAYPTLHTETPTLKGIRVLVSNQVPDNVGDATDESYIGLIDFSYVLFAEESGIEIKTSDQATIRLANGDLVHLFQQNMEAVLAEAQHDFNIEHLRAAILAKEVKWGANYIGSPNS